MKPPRYPDPFDHRRNWTRGVIVEVKLHKYAVDASIEQSTMGAPHKRSPLAVAHADGRLALAWVSRPQHAESQDVLCLLGRAQQNLRVLDGANVTHGLMARYVRCVCV